MLFARKRLKDIFINAFIVFVSISLFVLAAEAALRIFDIQGSVRFTRPDNLFSHRFREGIRYRAKTSEFSAMVSINSLGFRDDEFISPKPPGTFRIAVLGDSYCAALQVPLEKTFHSLLEKKFSNNGQKVDIVNLGVPAYGNAREWLLYRLLAKELAVDAVLWFVFPFNDVSDNADFIDHGFPYPGMPDFESKLAEARARPVSQGRKIINIWLDDHSYFYRWQKYITNKAAGRIKRMAGYAMPQLRHLVKLFVEPDLPESKRKWKLTSDIVKGFTSEMQADGMPVLAVVFMPRLSINQESFREIMLYSGYDPDIYDVSVFQSKVDELTGIFSEVGVDFVEMTPFFFEASKSGSEPIFYRYDGHWAPFGHRIVADVLTEHVEKLLLRAGAKI